MVLPLFPIVASAGVGMLTMAGLKDVFGGNGTTKKDTKIGGEYHAAQETYAPTLTDARVIQYPDYNIVMDSPLASIDTKKTATSSPDVSAGSQPTSGTNMTTLAIIGAAGLIVYGVVKK